jgi:molybdopterin molybdotransferase
MLSLEGALERVRLAAGAPCGASERVPLPDALGRVLARAVGMDHDVPPFRRATMDGYAVAAPDAQAGALLRVTGRVVAGDPPGGRVGAGEAVRVMTGAPVPTGAVRVVPFEWASEVPEGRVRLERVEGDDPFVVERGAHVRSGETVLAAGLRLDPGALGVLAAAGVANVEVVGRPRVALLGTGTELVPVEAAPGPGRIRNSNGVTLAAQARRAGAAPEDLGTVADEEGSLGACLAEALEAGPDLLLVSGGVSRGDLDLVPGALLAAGVVEDFHRWAVQPGGPLWFGTRGRTLVFGLPGNPAASYVAFELLAVPALRARLGLAFGPRGERRARYVGPPGRPAPRRRVRPVRLACGTGGRLEARALPWRGSGDLFCLAGAEGLAILPEAGWGEGPEAPEVDVLLAGETG